MAVEKLDVRGLKCPQPVLKIAAKSPVMKKGDLLEVMADCPTFEQDVKAWCERIKKPLLWLRKENDVFICQIQF